MNQYTARNLSQANRRRRNRVWFRLMVSLEHLKCDGRINATRSSGKLLLLSSRDKRHTTVMPLIYPDIVTAHIAKRVIEKIHPKALHVSNIKLSYNVVVQFRSLGTMIPFRRTTYYLQTTTHHFSASLI